MNLSLKDVVDHVELFWIDVTAPYARLVRDDNHAVSFSIDRVHCLGGTVDEFELRSVSHRVGPIDVQDTIAIEKNKGSTLLRHEKVAKT
nr:hypothetical protein [Salinibacter ruber]